MDNFKRLWLSLVVGFGIGMLLAFLTSINPIVVLVVLIFSAFATYFISGVKKADGSFKFPKLW